MNHIAIVYIGRIDLGLNLVQFISIHFRFKLVSDQCFIS